MHRDDGRAECDAGATLARALNGQRVDLMLRITELLQRIERADRSKAHLHRVRIINERKAGSPREPSITTSTISPRRPPSSAKYSTNREHRNDGHRPVVRESEIVAPARVDMKAFLQHLSTDEGIKEQQQLSAAYDRACHALIGPNDIQVEGDREFKKKSAWRKLQRHFTISTAVVIVQEKFVDRRRRSIFVAIVTVRAMAPWGQYAEAVGACATDEESGQRVITIADALATAETRATNRSVSNLIAMGEVSAEEIQKGNGSANGNGDMKRAEKDPGEFKIPFGPSKNKKLREMDTKDLEGALDWAAEKGKFDDFQKAAKAELDRRKNPPKKEEPLQLQRRRRRKSRRADRSARITGW
jgi:hypothetical protein